MEIGILKNASLTHGVVLKDIINRPNWSCSFNYVCRLGMGGYEPETRGGGNGVVGFGRVRRVGSQGRGAGNEEGKGEAGREGGSHVRR